MAAIADEMDPADTTVGMRVRLDHLRASPVGATVTVHAELSRVEGRRFTFEVSARQGTDEVAHGQVVRVLVDRERFLGVLAEVVGTFNWVCHAYCLMGNHYHLLVATPDANLSKGMRHLNGVYTQLSNRRHGRVGHLLPGRVA